MSNEKIVFLFDADGCIFTPPLIQKKQGDSLRTWHYTDEDLCTCHHNLWKDIKNKINQINPETVDVLCASNRQSEEIDQENSFTKGTGSFFPVLLLVEKIIRCFFHSVHVDKTLLPDLIWGLENGSTFQQAMNHLAQQSSNNLPLRGCPLEESKLILIYALLQHIGRKYMDAQTIHVHFYDDQIKILDQLNEYLSYFANLGACIVPKNIIFHMHHYDEQAAPRLLYSFVGQGIVNPNIKGSLQHIMMTLARWIPPHLRDPDLPREYREAIKISSEIEHYLRSIHKPSPAHEVMPHAVNIEEDNSDHPLTQIVPSTNIDSASNQNVPVLSNTAAHQQANSTSNGALSADPPNITSNNGNTRGDHVMNNDNANGNAFFTGRSGDSPRSQHRDIQPVVLSRQVSHEKEEENNNTSCRCG